MQPIKQFLSWPDILTTELIIIRFLRTAETRFLPFFFSFYFVSFDLCIPFKNFKKELELIGGDYVTGNLTEA